MAGWGGGLAEEAARAGRCGKVSRSAPAAGSGWRAVRPVQGGGSPELGKRKGVEEPPEVGKKVNSGGGSSHLQDRSLPLVFLLEIDLSLSFPSQAQ
jgi:hypothetical protein